MSAFGETEEFVKEKVIKSRTVKPPKSVGSEVLGPSEGYEWTKTEITDCLSLYTSTTKVPTLIKTYEIVSTGVKPFEVTLNFMGSKNYVVNDVLGNTVINF